MMPPKVSPYSVESCFGNKGCPNSIKNSEDLIKKLENILKENEIDEFILSKVKGKLKMHNSFRVGVANCPNACSQVHIKDFGIIIKAEVKHIPEKCNLCKKCVRLCPDKAIYVNDEMIEIDRDKCLKCGMCAKICPENAMVIKSTGYAILAGGKLGRHPSLAIEIENFTQNEEKLLDYFRKVLYFYKQECKSGERLGSIIQKTGQEQFLKFLEEEGKDEAPE